MLSSFLPQLILPLIIGLAVFLFGMKTMEYALFQWTGHALKRVLKNMTRTPLHGLLVGTGATALTQSSSAVTVITIGFVNAGVLTFPSTLGIILGTNIGSCITTELIGLRLSGNMLPVLLVSTFVWLCTWLPIKHAWTTARPKLTAFIRGLSLATAGFSCILLGIAIMQTIVPYLQKHGLLAWFIEQSQRSMLWGIVAGAVLTAIIHSSAASIAMTMGLAALGVIPVDLGIAIVLGCNIGTCATAMVASIGGSRFGHYVAWSHLVLNIGGAILFYPFIEQLHWLSAAFTSHAAGQIAHAQTIFNVLCSLVALPICYLPILRNMQPEMTAS
jgi:phosphate:Na+ symporter